MELKKTKTKVVKDGSFDKTEREIRENMPKDSIMFPVHLRGPGNILERMYACIVKNGLCYIVDTKNQMIEIQSYEAMNPNHLVFNKKGMEEVYFTYK